MQNRLPDYVKTNYYEDMKDMKNLSTQIKKFILDSKTNTSGTTEYSDNLIVLGPNRKLRFIGQKWSSVVASW